LRIDRPRRDDDAAAVTTHGSRDAMIRDLPLALPALEAATAQLRSKNQTIPRIKNTTQSLLTYSELKKCTARRANIAQTKNRKLLSYTQLKSVLPLSQLHAPAFCDLLSCDLLSNASITLELKAVVALQSSVKRLLLGHKLQLSVDVPHNIS
jgi:hypothetical protein